MVLKKCYTDKIIELQEKYPNIYLGGSVALLLQGAIPYREPKDVDLVCSDRIHIYDLFEIKDRPRKGLIKHYSYEEKRFELFFNPNAQYIEYPFEENIIKISPVEEILQWKFKYQLKNPDCIKNNADINHYMSLTSF